MADGLNSLLAAALGTFPNTTFSQNNAVIQLTGVASRMVGMLLALGLFVLGALPAFAAVFQMMPGGVLHGATGLLFAMIALVGLRMLHARPNPQATWLMAVVCIGSALLLTLVPGWLNSLGVRLPKYLELLLGFPVASGVVLAMVWELFLSAEENE